MNQVPNPDESFSSTVMSVINGMGSPDAQHRAEGLRRFLEQYSAPLCVHLLRKGLCRPDDAQDVVHDFFVDKFLRPPPATNLANKYLERKSQIPNMRFRAFMLLSLNNYAFDRRRRAGINTLELEAVGSNVAVADDPIGIAFEIDWAHNLLNRAIVLVREECHSAGQVQVWEIFERQVIEPARLGTPAPGYERLMRDLSLDSPKQASNRLQTAVRKFRRVIRELISAYLPPLNAKEHESALRDEIEDLIRALGHARPGFSGDASTHSDSLTAVSASLFSLNDHADELWREDRDLGAIWSHWLNSPLERILTGERATIMATLSDDRGDSLSAVLFDNEPSRDLYIAIKHEAKQALWCRSPETASLPTLLYVALYTVAISAAWVRMRQRITRDNDEQIAQRLRSCLLLTWLDERSRTTIGAWLAEISSQNAP